MLKVTCAKLCGVDVTGVHAHSRFRLMRVCMVAWTFSDVRACARPCACLGRTRVYTAAWTFLRDAHVRVLRRTTWCMYGSNGRAARRFVTHGFGRDARADCARATLYG